jgi:hypothetical protein
MDDFTKRATSEDHSVKAPYAHNKISTCSASEDLSDKTPPVHSIEHLLVAIKS